VKINTSPFVDIQLANPEAEFWWDSSPLVYNDWYNNLISSNSKLNTDKLSYQLKNFLNLENPTESFVRGVTTNPTLISNWIISFPEYWQPIIQKAIKRQYRPCIETTFHLIYQEAIIKSATAMMPLWESSKGKYGWVSAQTDPRYMFDVNAMLNQAITLSKLSPNIMLKIPASAEGYKVIEALTAQGISTNLTLSYTIPQIIKGIESVERGLSQAYINGVNIENWRSVITYMIGRFGSNTKTDLLEEARLRNIELTDLDIRWSELAIFKKAYRHIEHNKLPIKLLLSSLLVDNPSLMDDNLSMHLENTAGANVIYTCKPDFISQILNQQDRWNNFNPKSVEEPIPQSVMEKLLRLPSFQKSFETDGMAPYEFFSTEAFLNSFIEINNNVRRLIQHIEFETEHFLIPSFAGAA